MLSLPNRPTVTSLLPLLAVCSAPLLLIATLINPINQAGWLDPFIYTGYINDYAQLMERYGTTYYGNRSAFIFIGMLAQKSFGLIPGYLVSKLFYVLIATAAAYGIGRSWYGTSVGTFAAIWLCFSPWFVRAVAWDYVDGAAVAYLIVAIYFLLHPGRHPWLAHVAAGVALGLASGCNYFAITVALAFAPCWIIWNVRAGWTECVVRAAFCVLAFTAVWLVLTLVQYALSPNLGFFREMGTLAIGARLMAGEGAAWFKPLLPHISSGHLYTLLPLLLFVALLLRRIATGRTPSQAYPMLLAMVFLGSMIAFFLFLHFRQNLGALTVSFYFSYMIPAVLLALIALLGECAACTRKSPRHGLLLGGAFLVLVSWSGFPVFGRLIESISPADYAALALICLISLVVSRRCAILSLSACTALALGASLVFYHPTPEKAVFSGGPEALSPLAADQRMPIPRSLYSALHDRQWARLEYDVYAGSVRLLNIVGTMLAPNNGPVGFWYADTPSHTLLNSIQSTYLWGYSRLLHFGDMMTLSAIDANALTRLANFRYLVLLGIKPGEVETGLRLLHAAGVDTIEIRRENIEGGLFSFDALIVECMPRKRAVGSAIAELPLEHFSAAGGKLEPDGGTLKLTTSDQYWGYGAMATLTNLDLPKAPAVARVRLQVTSGFISLVATARGNGSKLIVDSRAWPSPTPIDVYLDWPVASEVEHLIVRNASPYGPSIVRILKVDILRPER
jgi:hypothetical protein